MDRTSTEPWACVNGARCSEVAALRQGWTIGEAPAGVAEAVRLCLDDVDDAARDVPGTALVISFAPGAA